METNKTDVLLRGTFLTLHDKSAVNSEIFNVMQ